MSVSLLIEALGGLALFLLAMQMMTEGLTLFAGNSLRHLLGRWTRTPVHGVGAGMLVTGLVQSSSAVTVATIGFVNAGVLTLRQALGVIYGANVGTTMTGWLVSLVGFAFKIEAFALPILTLGALLKLLAGSRRWQGLGLALAGFGLFFLGLSFLKEAFGSVAASYGASVASGQTGGGLLAFLAIGMVATVLTQSSSAAIAIILTAAAGGVVGIEGAAAAVIGANLGTTSTAAVAVLKATPAARRLAIGHIVFNLLAGVVALLLLGPMLWLVRELATEAHLEQGPAGMLALFHTVFNVLGVLLMLPLTERLARMLDRLFVSSSEALGQPRFLDQTLKQTPALAVAAVQREVDRLQELTVHVLKGSAQGADPRVVQEEAEAIRGLGDALTAYAAELRGGLLDDQAGRTLTLALAVTRHLREAVRLAPALASLQRELGALDGSAGGAQLRRLLEAIQARLPDSGEGGLHDSDAGRGDMDWARIATEARMTLLKEVVAGSLSASAADQLLDALSSTRRALTQFDEACALQAQTETPICVGN